ncbi:MAG: PDZ domain-containing protein [Planctomycetota bacterium]|nr:PDZ domain-containing protein [Planctomycetota bacterium]
MITTSGVIGAIGAGGAITCYSLRNGDVLWTKEVGKGPFLGVTLGDAARGALVISTLEGEAARRAGIMAGDVITSLGGMKVTGHRSLVDAISAHEPGDKVRVVVQRAGRQIEFALRLGSSDNRKTVVALELVDDDKVFAAVMAGTRVELLSLRADDGKVLWSRSLEASFYSNQISRKGDVLVASYSPRVGNSNAAVAVVDMRTGAAILHEFDTGRLYYSSSLVCHSRCALHCR